MTESIGGSRMVLWKTEGISCFVGFHFGDGELTTESIGGSCIIALWKTGCLIGFHFVETCFVGSSSPVRRHQNLCRRHVPEVRIGASDL